MGFFDQGHAVVIGVGSYASHRQMNVPATISDAEAVAEVLLDPAACGYHAANVQLLLSQDATREHVRHALDALGQVDEESTVIIFFAGHGAFGTDGRYYLMGYDAELEGSSVVAGTGVSDSELLTALERVKAKKLLLIVNACHAGAIVPTLALDRPPLLGEPLPRDVAAAALATGSGRAVITACRAGQYSFVGPGKLTLFAQALVDGLRGEGTRNPRHPTLISLFDLYSHLYFTLEEWVPQRVDASIRRAYGEMQEPEFTINKAVGTFPIALFRGATTLGTFDDTAPVPNIPAVRQVSQVQSASKLAQLRGTGRQQSIVIKGNNTGIAIAGDNTGVVVQNNASGSQRVDGEGKH
jgi:uncharacterized caspase-like protein